MNEAPSNNEASSGTSALDDGLGIWRRPRPPMYHLCTLDIHQTDKPLNVGVWEIIGFEEMDTPQEVFILRRFSPSEPSGQTGEQFKFWRRMYELGHMHVWRRGPDLLDPRFLMPNDQAQGAGGGLIAGGSAGTPGWGCRLASADF